VATSLGFTLVTEQFFGDPHKEAEMILFRRQAAPPPHCGHSVAFAAYALFERHSHPRWPTQR
jgi:hypothetical protein